MIEKFKNVIAVSDIVAVGRCGMITSTGGSINIEVDVEEVVKGQLHHRRIHIVSSVAGVKTPPILDPGERYIWFLQERQYEDLLAYSLAVNDANAIIPFNDEILQQIRVLADGQSAT